MDLEEKFVSGEQIYDGVIVKLYRDNITLPNGEGAYREYVRHPGAVCVVPITEEGDVICVKQYRYPHAEVLLEIPAGKLDFAGEDHAEAALRELREETGALSGHLEYMGVFYSSPAILDEKIYMYLATELCFGESHPDEDEFLEVERLPIETLVEMINKGEVPDGKTQAAVLRAYIMLNNK